MPARLTTAPGQSINFSLLRMFERPASYLGAQRADKPERPAPPKGLGEDAADDRSQAVAKSHSHAHHAEIVAALLERGNVGNGNLHQCVDGSRAKARAGARDEELQRRGAEAAPQVAGAHDAQRRHERGLAPENVRQASIDELDAGARDEEARAHEGDGRSRVQRRGNGWQAGGNGRLV
ncbi:hypothetical protein BBAD15_g11603 [Beauveria bassiana D1-5]|uniref:Uncharacterized protein n=1 Tax=Beauveria bassiana D1-5 TaxID=1245745 RepID=A0A0A2VAW6_BEABA|nr:hypothetical protein BBAD15_g11603 [Beauveria bassiana D1-5]